MNRTSLVCLLMLAVFLCANCAKPNPKQVVLREHSEVLYDYTKDACDENYTNYCNVLEKIITDSSSYNILVPPGIYAELGYVHFKNNNYAQAEHFFNLEKATYPEATVFIDRLLNVMQTREPDEKSSAENPLTENEESVNSDGETLLVVEEVIE